MKFVKNWKTTLRRAAMVTAVVGATFMVGHSALAAVNWKQVITPNDFEYKSLMTLVAHGAITDTKGIELGTQSYTMHQLIPLIADVTDKREQMNDNDKAVAMEIYRRHMDEVMAYNVAVDRKEKAEKKQKEALKKEEKARQKAAKQAAKQGGKKQAHKMTKKEKQAAKKQPLSNVPDVYQPDPNTAIVEGGKAETALVYRFQPAPIQPKASHGQLVEEAEKEHNAELAKEPAETVNPPEERALTDEQIKEKMDNFTIDARRIQVDGDLRIRYGNDDKDTKGSARARTQFTMNFDK